MSKTIVNLTLPLILGKIEETLQTFPHHPHQQLFANPDLRQVLIAYVLTRIPSNYVAVEETERRSAQITTHISSMELKSHLECLIHQGIHEILDTNHDMITHTIPEVENAGLAASHWFG